MNPSFIKNESGEFIGVNLSSDFCAEHEWGIDRIKEALGIPSKRDIVKEGIKEKFGIKGRTVTIFDEKMFFFEKGEKYICLTFEPYVYREKLGWKNRALESHPKKLATAWNDSSFGVVVDNQYQEFLVELYEAFKRKDIAIWLGGGVVFENPGLILVIASKIPKDISKKFYEQDMSYYKLEEKVKKTNIREILSKAGKQYLALSPRWKGNEENEIEFWLNPWDQVNNRCGWFTLEDLIDWTKNKGPIPI